MLASVSALFFIYVLWRLVKLGIAEVRQERLLLKYLDDSLVERILRHETWPGQTEEQLVDAIGIPDLVETVSESAHHKIFHYEDIGNNKFKSSIRLINGTVVANIRSNNASNNCPR